MTWYVRRRGDGSIASAHGTRQPGYAEEALPDDHPEIIALLASAQPQPALTADALAEALRKKGALTKAEIDAERGKK